VIWSPVLVDLHLDTVAGAYSTANEVCFTKFELDTLDTIVQAVKVGMWKYLLMENEK
jgi:hypothetical protein